MPEKIEIQFFQNLNSRNESFSNVNKIVLKKPQKLKQNRIVSAKFLLKKKTEEKLSCILLGLFWRCLFFDTRLRITASFFHGHFLSATSGEAGRRFVIRSHTPYVSCL